MTTRLLTLAVAVLSLLAPVASRAYSVSLVGNTPVRWRNATVPFYLDADGTKDISSTGDLDAVRRGVKSWNDVDCSKLVLSELGTTTSTNTNLLGYNNDINELVWLEDSRWEFSDAVLAVTTPVFSPTNGEIFEADITFNGENVYDPWTTNGSGTDVESVAVHELGHFFGLQHVLEGSSMADPPTMSPYVDPDLKTRTLTLDDKKGACFLYPQTGAYACSAHADCPRVVEDDYNSGQEFYSANSVCSTGTCVYTEIQPGSTPIGGFCTSDRDCSGDLFCQPLAQSGSYCAKNCTTNASCPSGFTCMRYSNSSGGACIDDDVLNGGTPNTTCDCDVSTACDGSCSCDPECGGSGLCECDATTACDPSCGCDPECDGPGSCACDTTTACTDGCDCDPECKDDGGGCMATPRASGAAGLGPLVVAGLLAFVSAGLARRKR